MAARRKRRSADFKAKVALEALKGIKTASELTSEFGVHPTQISQWKQQLIAGLPAIFGRHALADKASQKQFDELYRQIGQLTVECEWLKKN